MRNDALQAVAPRIERVNSRFFHVTDLVARNKMVAGSSEMSGPSPGNLLSAAPPPAAVEPTSANVIDQAMAIQQFGGDTNFFRRMSVKFIASVRGARDSNGARRAERRGRQWLHDGYMSVT